MTVVAWGELLGGIPWLLLVAFAVGLAQQHRRLARLVALPPPELIEAEDEVAKLLAGEIDALVTPQEQAVMTQLAPARTKLDELETELARVEWLSEATALRLKDAKAAYAKEGLLADASLRGWQQEWEDAVAEREQLQAKVDKVSDEIDALQAQAAGQVTLLGEVIERAATAELYQRFAAYGLRLLDTHLDGEADARWHVAVGADSGRWYIYQDHNRSRLYAWAGDQWQSVWHYAPGQVPDPEEALSRLLHIARGFSRPPRDQVQERVGDVGAVGGRT